ncbi:PASTA domain-containing protein [Kitasatospora sp. HPMI-4]|uniref:PASTA domain-containing protein n=1 Tax=Kitasatospora sp. HPMI-4 TaxID=3448443 RepID=UPI003F1BE3BC
MTSFPPDGHLGRQGSTQDHDFREALIQAMDNFAHDAHPPTFDGTAILRRTRRRRGLLAVAGSAVAVVLAAGTAFALNGSGEPPARQSAAASAGTATPTPVASGTPTACDTPVPVPAGTSPCGTPVPVPSGTPTACDTPAPVPAGTPPCGTPVPVPSVAPTAGGGPAPVPSGTPAAVATPSPGVDTRPGPGKASVTVPTVLGKSQAQAQELLTEAGLRIAHIQNFTDWKIPAGAVISVEPAAGAVVAPGTAVVLFVSKGKP